MRLALQRIWACASRADGRRRLRALSRALARASRGRQRRAARPRRVLPRRATPQVGRRATLLLSGARDATPAAARGSAARAGRRRARRRRRRLDRSRLVAGRRLAGRFAETEHLRRVGFVLNLLDGLLGQPADLPLGLVVEHDEADAPIHRIQRIGGIERQRRAQARRRAGSCSRSCRRRRARGATRWRDRPTAPSSSSPARRLRTARRRCAPRARSRCRRRSAGRRSRA